LYYNPRFTGNRYETLKSIYACVVVVVVVVVVVAAINTSPFYVPFYTMQVRSIDSLQWRFLSNAFKKNSWFSESNK
jgi:hypothetical protein